MSIIRDENNKPCDYRVTDANEVSSTFFGLPLESYIGSLASEKHPDYLQKLNFLEEILDSNSYREKDEYFPRTERYTHWVIYSPGKDEIVGLFLDSTGSVQANRALDRSEKLFQNIFANIPAGVEIYDKANTISKEQENKPLTKAEQKVTTNEPTPGIAAIGVLPISSPTAVPSNTLEPVAIITAEVFILSRKRMRASWPLVRALP